jgi:hypothetical protein
LLNTVGFASRSKKSISAGFACQAKSFKTKAKTK